MDMNERRTWNDNHKKLKQILVRPEAHNEVIQLFLSHHLLLHASSISQTNYTTLEDKLLKGLHERLFRQYPVPNPDTNNSIAWHLWHIARIEDMTMNVLVSDRNQVLFSEDWLTKMNVPLTHSGNDMQEEEIADLSRNIDINSLLAYRAAVGRRTREIITSLKPGQFIMKINADRIRRLFEENAVMEKSKWLADYWSKKNIAGLILMPATRHNFLHLNKSIRIKERLQKKLD
ncbi:DinB family protein [Ornithinibacillus xuwenensis]|uniref:DinB family protein n=1 Tax=Ornithinibacillus xuwenensis TaxID=3144668 RepID=A0ABU9XDF3_9BACI